MRTISWTSRFKKDFRREKRGRYGATLEADLGQIVAYIAADQPLPFRLRDHSLTGDWKDHRDCHIKPDLVLIYQVPDPVTLVLVRIGSHSELGL